MAHEPASAQSMKMLIPLWIGESENPALARMARRPVAIAIDDLDVVMRGQVVDLHASHALLLPDRRFYLCKSIYIEICFRFETTRYSLAGMAYPSSSDQSIRMEFDTVARKTLAGLGDRLKAAGLEDAEAQAPAVAELNLPEEPQEDEPKPQHRHKVRDEGPPFGEERREHPRYEVNTFVRLSVVDDARRLECTMIELSRGGCRLLFAESHGLSRGTQIEVQFIGDGLPLRMAAVVQWELSTVAGIKFAGVGARMVERLEWLLHEVTAGRAIAVQRG